MLLLPEGPFVDCADTPGIIACALQFESIRRNTTIDRGVSQKRQRSWLEKENDAGGVCG